MKKIGVFFLFLLVLSVPASAVAQEPAGDIVAPNYRPAPPSALATPPSVTLPSGTAPSQVGEATTPFQLQLQQAINQRKASGLPVPSSVIFEYQATSDDALQLFSDSTKTPTGPVKIFGKTIIYYDGPEQAGYDEWPALTVKDNLPPEAQGVVLEGDYTETYYRYMEEQVPGIWEQYEFGHEPRKRVVEETIEITFPGKDLLDQRSTMGAEAATTEDLLTGFTYTGPQIDYTIGDSEIIEVCVPFTDICADFTVYSFKAGFALDWALGLRLPAEADLTGPDQLVQGASNSLSSTLNPLDWAAASYSASGVAVENGNEFVLRLDFFLGVEAIIAEINVCPGCTLQVNVDESDSFATPLGAGSFFPIPPANIPVLDWDLGFASFAVGIEVDPNLGSDKITAVWQASGDASGSGAITYSNPGTPVSVGPVNACNLGPGNLANIQLNNFQYHFTQFLVELSASLDFDLFGTGVWSDSLKIIEFDLSPIFGGLGLHVGAHTQCTWDFNCTPTGPDNTLNLSIPVVDLTAPETGLSPSGTPGNNGWYISDVDVSLSATDLPAGCGIGVLQTEYSFDGVSWNVYSGSFTISDEGITTVYYRSTDMEGNVESVKTQIFKIDKTPPTITGAPLTAPNSYGWYNTDVVVHFVASDAVSGIDMVTPDQTLSGEGANQSVIGTAVDMAGLSASFTVTGINIDKTKPDISIASPEAKTYENTETFNVIWSVTDSLSGVASEGGTIDGDAVTNGQPIVLLVFAPGQHTVEVEAMDKADNPASASVVFFVTVDSEGLLAALEYMCDLGWIDKHGICNSLAAKLKAAIASIDKGNLKPAENQLNAFLNELEAQKGKSINQSAYDVLKAGALYVIEHLSDEA